jgi:hypothetical protein
VYADGDEPQESNVPSYLIPTVFFWGAGSIIAWGIWRTVALRQFTRAGLEVGFGARLLDPVLVVFAWQVRRRLPGGTLLAVSGAVVTASVVGAMLLLFRVVGGTYSNR